MLAANMQNNPPKEHTKIKGNLSSSITHRSIGRGKKKREKLSRFKVNAVIANEKMKPTRLGQRSQGQRLWVVGGGQGWGAVL